MDEIVSFGSWLKQQRRARDLTQAELARRISCATATIKKIEQDERRPSREIAERLAEALQLPAAEHDAFLESARGQRAADRLAVTPPPVQRPRPHAHPLVTDLPIAPTPLVGRAAEVAAVCVLLERPEVRLVTITGAGGIGKTRLALQVTADLRETFPDGVVFVDLQTLDDPRFVGPAIAQTLGLTELAGQPLVERLKHRLRDQHVLLVIYNFEQVVTAAPLVAALLAVAPRLKVLVTSRAILHLAAEHEYVLPPLALPDLTRSPDLATLAQSEAVALFVQRARIASGGFELQAANARAIATICVHLDGLPLAIELAAARTRLLSPEALLQRLTPRMTGRLSLLTGGPRDLPARQQTLRRTLAWSYNLLRPDEQRLFAGLGVFVGGWTVEAVDAVGTTADVPPERDVLDVLQSLLDKSLIQVTRSSTPDGGDSAADPRLHMLETIREYALEQLTARGAAALAHRQHACYYLAVAEQAATELRGAQQVAWLRRLDVEHDNFRAALQWALGQSTPGTRAEEVDGEIGLRLSVALGRFWMVRGYWGEGEQWLDRALDGARRAQQRDIAAEARVCFWRGELANWGQKNDPIARAAYEESLALARQIGDRHLIAKALVGVAHIAMYQGDPGLAAALAEESLALFQEFGDRAPVGRMCSGYRRSRLSKAATTPRPRSS